MENKWQLTFGYKPNQFDEALFKIKELIRQPGKVFYQRRDAMLENSINVTGFLNWFIQKYPESMRIMQTNPDYQYNFR
ncbi:MAG: hypothetical protein PHQ11_15775 [Paludibacter sp.]|nr:hypothetical protein [Paludibacter sp.]MDD4428836.1 hypothetical protein [Paludibacter sp.]